MNRGLEVDVIHLMGWLMDTQLDSQSGQLLKQSLEGLGVRFHLEKLTTTVLGDGHVTGLQFKDGGMLDCEMVVISAGIRANVDLARMAGLHVRRGILINDSLACRNDQDIYAIGECAEHRSQVYGLVAPLWEQARVLAERLAGRNADAVYTGSRVSTKLKVMGVELAVAGEKDPSSEDDEVVTYVEPNRNVYKKVIVRDGKVTGAILLGDGLTVPRILQAFDRQEALPENRSELLFPLAADAVASLNVEDLPDDAQICNCNGVTKARIVAAVDGGHRSLKAVCDATRAGTGCGSCKMQVQAVLELAADGLVADDPSAHYYVPGIPLTKPELIGAIKAMSLKSVSAVFDGLSGGKEDAGSKLGLASLLRTIWGRRLRRRTRRPLHQRPGARQHPEERDVQRGAAHLWRYHLARRAATHRRRCRKVRSQDGEDHRRSAYRPAGYPQGTPPRRLAGDRYAFGPRLHQSVPNLQNLRRHRFLPLRPRR